MANHNSKCISKKDRKELIKLLEDCGYALKRVNGSHSIYKNSNNGDVKIITINLNKMICKRIKKEVASNMLAVAE